MTIRTDTSPAFLTYPADSHKDSESAHRLIVLVPANIDFSAATQRIWGLAHATGMHIELLGLPNGIMEESRLRRELITMVSLLQDGQRCAEAKVEVGANWVDTLKTNYDAGDMIVCFAEQETGVLHRPVSQILESNLKAPVYILSDLAPRKANTNRLSQTGMWLGALAVIAGFGVLQIKIIQLPEGWFQNFLLILSIIVEFSLIWVWDSWFR